MSQRAGKPPLRLVAYADESHYNVGRYRGIAVVSLEEQHVGSFDAELGTLLHESEVCEFKWKKLDSAKNRFAAVKLLTWTLHRIRHGLLRIDVLIWDTEDSRHKVRGRDDITNLERMYHHIFKNLLSARWPDGSIWTLHPDEQTAIDWQDVGDRLDIVSSRGEIHRDLFTKGSIRIRLKQEFRVERVVPSRSKDEPLVQLADMFVGMAIFSRQSYCGFENWKRANDKQSRLFPEPQSHEILSSGDRERFKVLQEFDAACKRQRLGVSLRQYRGLRTLQPKNPINFWWYVPQHDQDRAPVKASE